MEKRLFKDDVARDSDVATRQAAGWTVETVPECEARDPTELEAFFDRITRHRADSARPHRPIE